MRTFLKDLFCESGNASLSRVGTSIALLFSCGWVTYLIVKTTQMPSLDGISLFIGTLYGIGKVNETIQKRSQP